jgi:hypothetical protein
LTGLYGACEVSVRSVPQEFLAAARLGGTDAMRKIGKVFVWLAVILVGVVVL